MQVKIEEKKIKRLVKIETYKGLPFVACLREQLHANPSYLPSQDTNVS